ncbi:MAG: alpha/beta fold hydrolase [Devosiaceae bacterium]
MTNKHIILIHGAWQGSWVWQDFALLLTAAGFTAHAVDLPGNGVDGRPPETVSIDDYVGHITQLIDGLAGDIILLGHSGGGVVATGAAEARAERISCVVYVAGMMLLPGMSFGDVLTQENAAERGITGIGKHLTWNKAGDVSSVPPEAGARIFLNDMPFDKALEGAKHLSPQGNGGKDIATQWTAERFGKIPRIYVECSQDLSVVPALQQSMQSLVPGSQNITLDAGHAPHVSQPHVLADALIPALKARFT